jgi:hypothetical protein
MSIVEPTIEVLGDGTTAAALHVALSTNGYREGRNNSNKFSTALGRPPEKWCADWVEWVLRTAGVHGVLASAYCPTILADYRARGLVVRSPLPGDQFFVMRRGTAIHTGLVTKVGRLSVKTIEGNTNTDGSSNGIGVFRRIRVRATLQFGRPAYVKPPEKHTERGAVGMVIEIVGYRDVYLILGPQGIVHIRNGKELEKFAGLPRRMFTLEEVGYYFGTLPNTPTPRP